MPIDRSLEQTAGSISCPWTTILVFSFEKKKIIIMKLGKIRPILNWK